MVRLSDYSTALTILFIPSINLEDNKKKPDDNQYLKEDIELLINFVDKDQFIPEENISILVGIMSVLDNERNRFI